jgi:hypothetical protein
LNILPLTPVPLQVPPLVPVINVLRLIAASDVHIAGGCDHAGLAVGVTVTACVAELEQPGEVTVYVVELPGDTVIAAVVAPPGDHE